MTSRSSLLAIALGVGLVVWAVLAGHSRREVKPARWFAVDIGSTPNAGDIAKPDETWSLISDHPLRNAPDVLVSTRMAEGDLAALDLQIGPHCWVGARGVITCGERGPWMGTLSLQPGYDGPRLLTVPWLYSDAVVDLDERGRMHAYAKVFPEDASRLGCDAQFALCLRGTADDPAAPAPLPASLTGDVTSLSLSRPLYTCTCPPCPKRKPRCQETTSVLYADSPHTTTGMLVEVHRKGQPEHPLDHDLTMTCECQACP
jgi:hypothetical protein